ncbi:MAG: alpha-glucan family phosphorylase [Ignavibacteriae bacterium]|nr:alpha-glucan family phosphorylase [Ignavibacteriota bacterium]MCB9244281.1 alpha-glucan family phosphorylase [Ignavibacteriales bacterium]
MEKTLILKLTELSYNLYWSWNNDFYTLFDEIDHDKWEWSTHNPVKFLNEFNTDLLLNIIYKKSLENKIDELYEKYHQYMVDETYFSKKYFKSHDPIIAYFSAEYGITECLKFYSGGLGVLSGDHMKSSSDLGIPLVGVGLAYANGYFAQLLDEEGRQVEIFEDNIFENLPMYQLRDDFNNPIIIELGFPGRSVYVKTWVVNVGRTKLYLLDTNHELNEKSDKHITDILYGGDNEKRIEQEIVLGIGGVRILKRLGYDIKAFHLNEGHSAFLCVERIKNYMESRKVDFAAAKAECFKSNIFTTHTPVPAGFDIFSRDLIDKYFKKYVEYSLGISVDTFMEEGALPGKANGHEFNMAHLAINNSSRVNGVSKLHGEVSRKMWDLPPDRNQITNITNGIHTLTFLSKNFYGLFEELFGKDWHNNEEVWNSIEIVPNELIWSTRENSRKDLIKYIRTKLKLDGIMKGFKAEDDYSGILDPEALTLGFARRFATYKRGNLIFKDIDRLRRIVGNSKMPIQFVFSGKAHPKDEEGKNLIEQIVVNSKDEVLKNKVVFLENYNLDVAKHLVRGCDVWLNNPRRPMEASGTSGMKVIPNGGLNFSILDGWWNEAYRPDCGWMIDSADNYSQLPDAERDEIELNSLFDTLEGEIIPLFYDRNTNNIPEKWVNKIKNSIKYLAGVYNTNRMVREYTEELYMKVIYENNGV